MDFFPKRTIMPDTRLSELPRKKDLFAGVRSEEFHMSFFDIAEHAAKGEDRLHILGKILDRVFKLVDPGFQIICPVRKTLGQFGRTNEFIHKKLVMGPRVSLFFITKLL